MKILLFLYTVISINDLSFDAHFTPFISELDVLTPYTERHGSRLSYREISRCQKTFKGAPHELYQSSNTTSSQVETRIFKKELTRNSSQVYVKGHYGLVTNPSQTLSILEPAKIGGCQINLVETVKVSSQQSHCVIAANAGYFNQRTGECLGNVVSDGRKVKDSNGIQNAHFGIKRDGSIFIGYLSEEELKNGPGDFIQLVGGVVWLVRRGKIFVNESMHMECESTEGTGSMDDFVNISSARTAVGHDKDGNVLIVQVDGKSRLDGVNLWEMASLMIEFGAFNAINLDGGGSATFVINGTVVNYPSDTCDTDAFICERKVTTILCIHRPMHTLPNSCKSELCDQCNCSSHGRCTDSGCVCSYGWSGTDCNEVEDQFFNFTLGPCRTWIIASVAISSFTIISLLVNCGLCFFTVRSLGLCTKTRRQRSAYKNVNLGELLVTSSDEETETILHHK